jgi:hypothetical protein
MENQENAHEKENSCRKIWWCQKKAVPLQPLLRNNSNAKLAAPLAQLVEQLTLNQWV